MPTGGRSTLTQSIVLRGGVLLHPRGTRESGNSGRLRLLYEVNPISFLVEQAGGLASTGHTRALTIVPTSLRQRIGLIFGSSDEVSRIERYHRGEPVESFTSPLFGRRGLFAAPD